MFGLFSNRKKIDQLASHIAALMNLKMLVLKESISGNYEEETMNDSFFLGWAFGLSSSNAYINSFNDRDTGTLLIRTLDALFKGNGGHHASKASKLALEKKPTFLAAMEKASKEYHPIYEKMKSGNLKPDANFFPSLEAYVDQVKWM